MNFWLPLIGYEAVWFVAVIGAGRDLWWPGVAATVLFAIWRLVVSPHRSVEVRIALVALVLGIVFDAALVAMNLTHYAAAWPLPVLPAWLTALWVAFALTIVPLFAYLHARPWLAAQFGFIGGPLAYLGAAHGWHAVTLSTPTWRALLALAFGWGIALPLLCLSARHWLRMQTQPEIIAARSTP